MTECPFCGHDPYHYVDIGVGMERVAVTCCEFGIELFDHRNTGDVTMSREEFYDIADQLRQKRKYYSALDDAIVALQGILLHPADKDSWDDAKAAMPHILETFQPSEEPHAGPAARDGD
jgi:hypothetical protein